MDPLYWFVAALGVSVVVLSVTLWLVYRDLRKRTDTMNPLVQAELEELSRKLDAEKAQLKGIYRELKLQIASLQTRIDNGEDPTDTVNAIKALETRVDALSDDEQAEDPAPES